MQTGRDELERQVVAILLAAGVTFRTQVALGGLRLDFLLDTPGARQIVLELKPWPRGIANLRRARGLARYLLAATKVDEAYIVMPDAPRKGPERGILGLAGLTERAPSWRRLPGDNGPKDRELRATDTGVGHDWSTRKRSPRIFAAMPFAPAFDDVYYVAIVSAAQQSGATAERVDAEDFTGDIVSEIRLRIESADLVVADLTGASPNVLYEVGLAHGLAKPTIHVSADDLRQLPFDVRNWNTIKYEQGQTHRLAEVLGRRVKAILAPQ
jgi:hypothetical protein